jgi:NAD(P)-dependent dehydrogenase (short-subunit alcohol dehydrogenase family)
MLSGICSIHPMTAWHDLHGKVALVTGASSGLGQHFAAVLAKAGVSVGLAARRLERLQRLAQRIAAEGGRAAITALDVREPASIAAAVSNIESALGPIDILVNNSGTALQKLALETTAEDWDAVVNVNLKGAFLMATAVARSMRHRARAGSIINIESILSFRQTPSVVSYAAAKAGLTQLTRSLALELARHQIRVNGIAPGYIATEINREFFASEAGAAMINRIPQRRLGQPEDLDGPLLLLASDASRYMTGATLVVDGGHLCSAL